MEQMPKVKRSSQKKSAKTKSRPRKVAPVKPARARGPAPLSRTESSPEYAEYLERYAILGTGRPRLTQAEFDRLDDELLDLLGLETDLGLNDEQIVRLQEIEYLLIDSEQ